MRPNHSVALAGPLLETHKAKNKTSFEMSLYSLAILAYATAEE